MKQEKVIRLRVVAARTSSISLRASPDRRQPEYEEWLTWQAGEEFEPPAHMDVEKALARGIVEVVG